MALPQLINKGVPDDTDNPQAGASVIRQLKTYLEDVFGLSDNVNYTAAAFAITTAGIVTISQAGFKIQDGSGPAPALAFVGASNIGFFRDAVNVGLGVGAGGTQIGYWNATSLVALTPGPNAIGGIPHSRRALVQGGAFIPPAGADAALHGIVGILRGGSTDNLYGSWIQPALIPDQGSPPALTASLRLDPPTGMQGATQSAALYISGAPTGAAVNLGAFIDGPSAISKVTGQLTVLNAFVVPVGTNKWGG